MIRGGFGTQFDLERGVSRRWYCGPDGVRRWLDNDEPTEAARPVKTYRYAAVNRPPGYATVPEGYLRVDPQPARGEPFHDWARHGIVVYDRALTDAETCSYELAPLLDAGAEQALAEQVAEQYRDHADGIEDMLREGERGWFVDAALSAAEKLAKGYRPLVPDPEAFADRVLALLRA